MSRLFDNRNFLGFLFMLPAAALLLVFLTYPLGLGTFLGFTDAKIGRAGEWIGIENYEFLVPTAYSSWRSGTRFLYTAIASVIKFGLGLWLALLLNEHLPFKAFIRAIVLLPFIVPTVLSAIAFWWIYDAQFSVISWMLTRLGVIDTYINFLGDPDSGPHVADHRQCLAWCAVHCNLPAGGSANYLSGTVRSGGHRRCQPLAEILACHLADALADHRGGHDVLGAVHVHRLSAHLGADARRPDQRHAFDGNAVVPASDPRVVRSAKAPRSQLR